MATIVIDAGHGGTDPGAVNGMRRESADILGLAMAVGRILECRCHQVIYTRQSDIFIPLQERANISNRAGANAFISIHRNASVNPAGNGIDAFHRVGANANERQLSNNILARLNALGVFNNRGVHGQNFLVLTATNAPASLVEVGFISNTADNSRFDANVSRIVEAIANGIEDSVGRVSGCGVVTPPPPPPPTTPGILQGTVRTTGGNLNVRSAPSTTSSIIKQIPNGTSLQIIGERSGFYQVIVNGTTGWVSSDFVQPASRAGRVSTQGGNLNLRNAPSASAPIIATMPNYASVTISDIIGDFYRVSFGGVVGWANRNFIAL